MLASPDLHFEEPLWKAGILQVAGLDEAGRGALAGPVAVGAVVLPADPPLLSRTLGLIRDSKLMTPPGRDRGATAIQAVAISWAVGFASAVEIDALGIVPAVRLAASRALAGLVHPPEFLLTDFRLELPELDLPQDSMVHGDAVCLSIAAASVLAKTARDALMRELDGQYPGYGLGKHKGYGTRAHRESMSRLGVSPIHRKSFSWKSSRVDERLAGV